MPAFTKEEMRKNGIVYEVSSVSFDGVLPEANHRQRVLKDSERQRLLKESPVWLRGLLIAGLETCLSEGDLLRLRWEDIDEETGAISPDGGRLKTAVRQDAPLTDAVKKVLAEIKRERQRAKVRNLDTAIWSLSVKMVPQSRATPCTKRCAERASVPT